MAAISPIMQVITGAMRKASRYAGRDFVEISFLQSSQRGSQNFASKTMTRLEERLAEALNAAHPEFPLYARASAGYPGIAVKNKDKRAWYVQAISGLYNLERAIPFFAMVVVAVKETDSGPEPIACMVDAPLLGECFTAEKGYGAWCEAPGYAAEGKQRLRVSQKSIAEESLILTHDVGTLELPTHVKQAQLGSLALNLAYVAAGRADASVYQPQNTQELASWLAGRLLVSEAGGKAEQDSASKRCIAANATIAKSGWSA